MNARNSAAVDPAAIIEMLVDCGLLNRNVTNRRLLFAHDPVAEYLAAQLAAQGAPRAGIALLTLKERMLLEPTSAIAGLMAEIASALRPQPRETQPAGAATPI
jgi:hypothetical protein